MTNQKGIAQLIILVILVIGIAVTVFLIQRYTSFLPKASESSVASLRLSPSQISTGASCTVSVDINLDTAGFETAGTDATILFDPQVLQVTSVTKGKVYPSYPSETIDNTNGKVMVSGLAYVGKGTIATGVLATVVFKVNSAATTKSTEVRVDFDPANPQKTTDSNIVDSKTIRDLLGEVTNATLSIDPSRSCLPSPSPSPTPATSVVPSPAPSLMVTITKSKNNQRVIANVSWKGVYNAHREDKIFLTSSTQAESTRWIYATTCTQNLTPEAQPKTEGNCPVVIMTRGTHQFSYNQVVAHSEKISF